jgi:hypothetical protein
MICTSSEVEKMAQGKGKKKNSKNKQKQVLDRVKTDSL